MGGGGGGEITTTTFFYYKVYLPSKGVLRTEPVYLYDAGGLLIYTLAPNDPRVDYENGMWEVPSQERSTIIESISTASYWLMYSADKLEIDYDNMLFKIDKSLILNVANTTVTADFEYATALAPIYSGRNMFDGRWDTQAQVVFYSKPPASYAFAEIDLGQVYTIQAIDIIHGFFKPDDKLTFDINNKYSLEYSTDGITYYPVCREATNFNLTGGASISFERDNLGDDFSVRYFKLIVNDMEKIAYKNGCWVVAFVEFAAFKEVILKGESLLVPTTHLSSAYVSGTTLNVDDTTGFLASGTAYLEDETAFTYTAVTATSFTGCSGLVAVAIDSRVSQTLETTTSVYDEVGLLPTLKDKLFKNTELNIFLDTTTRVNKRAKDWLIEGIKDHSKCSVNSIYAPHVRVGQTLQIIDSINGINRRYFIESIKGTDKGIDLILAYYS